ncbi:MAG: hypothetical protein K0S39_1938 [Paenibacillus sp.]|nr:hypothetical protein [Paenibacillus sp.]
MSGGAALKQLKQYARRLKQNLYVLYLAYKDPRVAWYAKCFPVCIVAYAFSPIDLIPDFIPVLGYLDDLIIVPFGIYLALKMIPSFIIDEHRQQAEAVRMKGKPKNWFVGILFILIWILAAAAAAMLVYRKLF